MQIAMPLPAVRLVAELTSTGNSMAQSSPTGGASVMAPETVVEAGVTVFVAATVFVVAEDVAKSDPEIITALDTLQIAMGSQQMYRKY